MRAAFDVPLRFARTDRRGGRLPVVEHQGVGFLLADVKTRIEAVRALTLRACAVLDTGTPGAEELRGREGLRVRGGRAVADRPHARRRRLLRPPPPARRTAAGRTRLPLFSGGNIGFRRRRLQALLADPDHDPWSTIESA
jgi:butyryl-CoA dehydrogenase